MELSRIQLCPSRVGKLHRILRKSLQNGCPLCVRRIAQNSDSGQNRLRKARFKLHHLLSDDQRIYAVKIVGFGHFLIGKQLRNGVLLRKHLYHLIQCEWRFGCAVEYHEKAFHQCNLANCNAFSHRIHLQGLGNEFFDFLCGISAGINILYECKHDTVCSLVSQDLYHQL